MFLLIKVTKGEITGCTMAAIITNNLIRKITFLSANTHFKGTRVVDGVLKKVQMEQKNPSFVRLKDVIISSCCC